MGGVGLLPVIQAYATEKMTSAENLSAKSSTGNEGHNARTSTHWKNARIMIRGMLFDAKGDEQKRLQQLLHDVEKWIKTVEDHNIKK